MSGTNLPLYFFKECCEMYKLMKVNKILNVGDQCCRVEYEYVGEFESLDEQGIIAYANEHNFEDDFYIIENINELAEIKTEGILFFKSDDTSYVDVAEHDYEVIDFMAHHPVSDKRIWELIREYSEEYDLLDKILDVIEDGIE